MVDAGDLEVFRVRHRGISASEEEMITGSGECTATVPPTVPIPIATAFTRVQFDGHIAQKHLIANNGPVLRKLTVPSVIHLLVGSESIRP